MFAGYELTGKSRGKILAAFPPKYDEVICHHITSEFGVPSDSTPPKQPKCIRVIGYADDGEMVEGLLVEVDGTINRPDGRIYHITLSIDREKGARPVSTNDIIHKAVKCDPIELEVTPKVFT